MEVEDGPRQWGQKGSVTDSSAAGNDVESWNETENVILNGIWTVHSAYKQYHHIDNNTLCELVTFTLYLCGEREGLRGLGLRLREREYDLEQNNMT